jgi:hypothetical protein
MITEIARNFQLRASEEIRQKQMPSMRKTSFFHLEPVLTGE